jgi:hypothetical protein
MEVRAIVNELTGIKFLNNVRAEKLKGNGKIKDVRICHLTDM